MTLSITEFLKLSGNEFASIAEDGITAGDISGFVDTGSYTLNAVIAGSLFKGLPMNKISALAGETGVGKTFFALGTIKNFLEQHENGLVFYFETESAISKEMFKQRGIDTRRVAILPVGTVQEFKNQSLKIVDNYEKQPEKQRQPVIMILDSLGNLSTTKEMADSLEGNETKDMTRAQVIKAAFRVLTLKLGRANIPLICTNHVYSDMAGGPYAGNTMSGGCLLEGTQIIMADGSFRNIEDVEIGEFVLTENDPEIVTMKWTPENLEDPTPECLRIHFDDGTFVECSESHKFRINGEWVQSKDLAEGDLLECR